MKVEEIHIDSLAYGGDGVGRVSDGRVAFVSGAFPGDVCVAEYIDDDNRFVRPRMQQLVKQSDHRTQSACPEAHRCGGCPWAQLVYDQQLRWKRQFVVDALVRIARMEQAHVEKLVEPCVQSKKQLNYRNKVEFEVGQDVAGRFALGMHAKQGDFVPLAACRLCSKKLEGAPRALTGALRFAAGQQNLGIQRVGVRFSERTKSAEIALWTSTGRFPRARVAQILGEALAVKAAGVTRVLLKDAAKTRKVAGVESLRGAGCWSEEVAGRILRFSAPSFFQVNTPGAETLVDLVMDCLQPDGLDFVLDLYSGAGTFTLPLAQQAHRVAAVESASSSVKDLRRNLERNELSAQVIGGDAARELLNLGRPDKVVVDPPRSGLGAKAVEGLLATKAHAIAYVSCNPTTLARDLTHLLAGGYHLERVVPVDLFPQTYHVETVALLAQ